jgi:hypothetical protein
MHLPIDLRLAAASAAYALLLEPMRPLYERHRLTVATVAGGVALTGVALDHALRHELAPEQHRRVMRLFWRLFVVSGLPMIFWQALVWAGEREWMRRSY